MITGDEESFPAEGLEKMATLTATDQVTATCIALSLRFPNMQDLEFGDLTIEEKHAIYTYIRGYRGSNSFLVDVRTKLGLYPALSPKQLVAIARTMVRNFQQWLDKTQQFIQFSAEGLPGLAVETLTMQETPSVPVASVPVQAGIYSVTTAGQRSTLKVVPVQSDNPAEERAMCLSYLFGPNNEVDYRGFCYLMKDGSQRFWTRKIAEDPDLGAVRSTLMLAVKALLAPSGTDRVLEAAHCNRCGRLLTVDVSIHNGYGPECIKHVGG